MDKPVTCRICFNTGDDNTSFKPIVNNVILQNLNLIAPSTIRNLQLTEDPVICQDCVNELKIHASFKETVITNEFKIQCHQKKDNNFFLSSLSDDIDRICRLCLNGKLTGSYFTKCWKDIKNMFVKCNIHLNLNILKPSRMCDTCFTMLEKMYHFVCSSTEKENKLIVLYAANNYKILNRDDLYIILNELRKRHKKIDEISDADSSTNSDITDPICDKNSELIDVKDGCDVDKKIEQSEIVEKIDGLEAEGSKTRANIRRRGNLKRRKNPPVRNNMIFIKKRKKSAGLRKCNKTIPTPEQNISSTEYLENLDIDLNQDTNEKHLITNRVEEIVQSRIDLQKLTKKQDSNQIILNTISSSITPMQTNKSLSEAKGKVFRQEEDLVNVDDINGSDVDDSYDETLGNFESQYQQETEEMPNTESQNILDESNQSKIVPQKAIIINETIKIPNIYLDIVEKYDIMELIRNSFEFTEEPEEHEVQKEQDKNVNITQLSQETNQSGDENILNKNEILDKEQKQPHTKMIKRTNLKNRLQLRAFKYRKIKTTNKSRGTTNVNQNIKRRKCRIITNKVISAKKHKLHTNKLKWIKNKVKAKKLINRKPTRNKLAETKSKTNKIKLRKSGNKRRLNNKTSIEENRPENITNTVVELENNDKHKTNDHQNDTNKKETIRTIDKTVDNNEIVALRSRLRNRFALIDQDVKERPEDEYDFEASEEENTKPIKNKRPKKRGRKPNALKEKKTKESASTTQGGADNVKVIDVTERPSSAFLGCSRCPYKTKSMNMMNQHKIIHSVLDTVQKIKCQLCSFQCKTKDQLEEHNITHKIQEDFFSCIHCDFLSKRKASIVCHTIKHEPQLTLVEFYCAIVESQTDNEIKCFECLQCDMQKQEEEDIRSHLLTHVTTNELKHFQMFSCPKCIYKTKSQETLKKHEETQHICKEFRCRVCKFRTKIADKFEKHEASHKEQGDFPNPAQIQEFRCELCSFITSHKRSLVNHVNMKHKRKPKEANATTEESKPTESPLYRCADCLYVTDKKKNMLRHAVVHKTKQNMFFLECPHCTFETKHRRSYIRHLDSVHKVPR